MEAMDVDWNDTQVEKLFLSMPLELHKEPGLELFHHVSPTCPLSRMMEKLFLPPPGLISLFPKPV